MELFKRLWAAVSIIVKGEKSKSAAKMVGADLGDRPAHPKGPK